MNLITNKDLEVLVNFSGGIDSTYLLYKLLSENKNILIHHCQLENHENRAIPENIATNQILKYFNDNNLGTFKYVNTGFHYGNAGYIVKDVEVIAFMSSVILRNPEFSNIKEIAISANSEDETTNPNDISMIRRGKILDAILPSNSNINLTYPIIHMSKREIIDDMPEELFKMTWFCRKPIYFNKDGVHISGYMQDEQVDSWKVCGSCRTCKQVFDGI